MLYEVITLHVPVVLWSGVVNLAGWTCPLTPLEKRYQKAYGHTPYQGSFTERYLQPLVYPKGMPRRLEIVAGVSVLAWNALAYLVILYLKTPAPA